MQYTFSYMKLHKLIMSLAKGHKMTDEDVAAAIRDCVVALTDTESKTLREGLNDQITRIYTENGIEKTLRFTDPFNRVKDYIMMEGTATSFSKDRALPIGVAGIYEWKCPECNTHNFTATKEGVFCVNTKCLHFHHSQEDLRTYKNLKLHPLDLESSHIKRVHQMNADALTAMFDAATTHTRYVTLQARDVKESNGDEPKPRRGR